MMRRLALLLAVLWLVPDAAWSLNLSTIRTAVRRNVRDTSSTAALQRYSDSLLTDMANEAVRDIVNATWALEGATRLTLSQGTTYYNLPTDYIAAIKVYYRRAAAPNTVIELKEETRKSLLASNPNWENSAGSPSGYYVRQSTTSTTQQIALVPPINSSSTGTATVEYVSQPTGMSDDLDQPFGGESWLIQYHDLIVYYVTARLMVAEGKTDQYELYAGMYEGGIQTMRERIAHRPNYTPSFRVGTTGR